MRKRRSLVVTTSIAVFAALLLPGGADAGTPDSRPDAMIQKGGVIFGSPTYYKGFGVYNHNGNNQSITRRARPGKTVKMVFAGINAGDMPDDIGIIGCKSAGPVVVHWLVPGTTVLAEGKEFRANDAATLEEFPEVSALVDVTDEVQDGILFSNVAPGAGYGFVMKAKVKRSAKKPGTFYCYFDTGSDISGLYDTALAKVVVRV